VLPYEYLRSERRNDETWIVIRKSVDEYYPYHWFSDNDDDGDDEFPFFKDDLADMYDVVQSNGWIDYMNSLRSLSSEILETGFLDVLYRYKPSL